MYTREIIVQPSDVSNLGTIKLKNLLDYFQDTAGLAVENIEGTTTELIARGYAWVLTRYEIEFPGKMPGLDEKFIRLAIRSRAENNILLKFLTGE